LVSNNLSVRPGYLTDNRGMKNRIGSDKWSVRYCGLSVFHFNIIKTDWWQQINHRSSSEVKLDHSSLPCSISITEAREEPLSTTSAGTLQIVASVWT